MTITPFIINIISFITGTIFGMVVSSLLRRYKVEFNSRNLIVVIVTVAWLISIISEIINPGVYKTPYAVHTIMGIIVGSLFKSDLRGLLKK